MTAGVGAEEGQNEDRSLSNRDDHAAPVRGRPADKSGGRGANRKVRGVLPELVRDSRQSAGLLQRPLHRHALLVTV